MAEWSHVKVYSGLALQRSDVERVLPGAQLAPPVERGDVMRDIALGVAVIVIVDGRFLHTLAVSPGELMDALRRGIRLYGCSSMGAMRAAELEAYGMIGHGEIFELIRRAAVFSDDLLGQTFREDPLRALTVPHMDLHFALCDLVARGRARSSEADAVREVSLALPFAERDLRRIQGELRRVHGQRAKPLAALAERALRGASQKRLDALATLSRVKSDLTDVRGANRRLVQLARRANFIAPEQAAS